MKNNCLKRFNVRLNLKKSTHLQAWEILQKKSASYTDAIVNALISRNGNQLSQETIRQLSSLIRNAVSDALRSELPTQAPISEKVPDSAPISDEDFDIAYEFMSCL